MTTQHGLNVNLTAGDNIWNWLMGSEEYKDVVVMWKLKVGKVFDQLFYKRPANSISSILHST